LRGTVTPAINAYASTSLATATSEFARGQEFCSEGIIKKSARIHCDVQGTKDFAIGCCKANWARKSSYLRHRGRVGALAGCGHVPGRWRPQPMSDLSCCDYLLLRLGQGRLLLGFLRTRRSDNLEPTWALIGTHGLKRSRRILKASKCRPNREIVELDVAFRARPREGGA
jgi:hypothetical protein